MFKLLSFIIISIFCLRVPMAAADVNITPQDIDSALKKEFVEQGMEEDVELEIYGGQDSFNIPGAVRGKILVSNLKYDETQNKFSADVEIFADGKSYAGTSLLGKYYPMVDVCVPARNIDKGEILQPSDLKKIKLRSGRIKANYITQEEKLLGKEAKRMLKQGKLISSKEVGDKILVHKNDKVNLLYKTERMQIIAQGVAQEDGALGQRIELENTQSHKKVYGTIISSETIEVEN